jgi:hypothetical protein
MAWAAAHTEGETGTGIRGHARVTLAAEPVVRVGAARVGQPARAIAAAPLLARDIGFARVPGLTLVTDPQPGGSRSRIPGPAYPEINAC